MQRRIEAGHQHFFRHIMGHDRGPKAHISNYPAPVKGEPLAASFSNRGPFQTHSRILRGIVLLGIITDFSDTSR